MSGSYAYSSGLWPALITIALILFLGWYSWHRRNVPGAKAFVIGSIFATLWAIGALLEISAIDVATKEFWAKFQIIWQIPTVTALMCFVLVYAGLGRLLTLRNIILLAVSPIVFLGLIVTNDYHHLVWIGFQVLNHVILVPGIGNRIFLSYAYVLGIVNVIVLIWLAVRSPQHRLPVALMLFGQITSRAFYLLDYVYAEFLAPEVTVFFVLGLLSALYAIALFHFHVFDPVPLARSAVIEQMHEGMLVLGLDGRIVDLNPAAARILGNSASGLRGKVVTEVLPVNIDLPLSEDKSNSQPKEITLGIGSAVRFYRLNVTSLLDKRNQLLGQLLLLYEITEQKQAHSQIMEQQRVVATLQERERLARELHDSIGQVLGYVNLQAQTIQKWVHTGNNDKAESLLIRLAEVAKGSHTDIRESILSLKAGSGQEWAFFPALKKYLSDFQANYNIHTELSISERLTGDVFEPGTEIQLLRVIQEALTNARKHSGARMVRVDINRIDGRGYINISDDGSGFDANQVNQKAGNHFGLAIMRERMAQIRGSVTIESRPGTGTIIKLEAPIRIQQERKS